MRGGQDAAIGALGQRAVEQRVLARQHREIPGPAAQQVEGLRLIGAAILEPDDIGEFGQPQQRIVGKVDAGAVGDVVDDDRLVRLPGERSEMAVQPVLRGPGVIGAGDRDIRRPASPACAPAPCQLACVAARQTEIDRPSGRPVRRRRWRSSRSVSASSRVSPSPVVAARINPSTGSSGVVPDEPLERGFIQTAVPERRDERKPESLEAPCMLFQLSFSFVVVTPEERKSQKNPVQPAGLFDLLMRYSISAHEIPRSPE